MASRVAGVVGRPNLIAGDITSESNPAGPLGIGPIRSGRRACTGVHVAIRTHSGPTSRDNGGAGCKQRTCDFRVSPFDQAYH